MCKPTIDEMIEAGNEEVFSDLTAAYSSPASIEADLAKVIEAEQAENGEEDMDRREARFKHPTVSSDTVKAKVNWPRCETCFASCSAKTPRRSFSSTLRARALNMWFAQPWDSVK